MEPSETTKRLEQAWNIYRRRGAFDDAGFEEAVKVLQSHGFWSLRAMEKILDVPYSKLRAVVEKPERTGGRFNPETLELMLEESRLADRGDSNPELTLRITQMGTSWSFLGRVLDQTDSKVLRRLRKAQEGDG